ncbi:hypothetical protein VP01_10059g1, partial [Puccinia sorghi]
ASSSHWIEAVAALCAETKEPPTNPTLMSLLASLRIWSTCTRSTSPTKSMTADFQSFHAELGSFSGVLINSPQPSLCYLNLNSKKRRLTVRSSDLDGDDSSGAQSSTNMMSYYLDFIKVRPDKKQNILDTLKDNDIDCYKLFKSKNITHDHMS